jgi:hypothetical protein
VTRLRKVFLYLRAGQLRVVGRALLRRFYSDNLSLGLRRDATLPFSLPKPGMSLEIRPIEAADASLLSTASLQTHDVGLQATSLLESGIRTGYVAVTKDGQVCYLQFLVDSSQNARLQALFGGIVPPLAPDEALLEAAFSPPRFRGRGIMLHVLPELARKAEDLGARWLVLYASVGDLPMLKACKWCGFQPSVLRRTSYRLFRRRLSFTPLAEGTPYPFEVEDWSVLATLGREA